MYVHYYGTHPLAVLYNPTKMTLRSRKAAPPVRLKAGRIDRVHRSMEGSRPRHSAIDLALPRAVPHGSRTVLGQYG